jgi:agmatinase
LAAALTALPLAALADWVVPEALEARVEALDETQARFITSGAILDFIPEAQLRHELATRDVEAMGRLLDDLLALSEEMAYDETRDMGAIPLNLASKRYNFSEPTPAPLRKHERAPGPFSVNRYLFPTSGVPTFGGAKVAIFADDLVAGDVDVAIVGVPSNFSSGRRDAGSGPAAMRALNTIGAPDGQTLVDPMAVLNVVDYGDFAVGRLGVERGIGHVTDRVAETAETGAVPMLVGGDTSMLYPGVKGVARVHGAGAFGLLHFSAHPDANRHDDHTMSDDQALFGLLEEGIVAGDDTVAVGLRGPAVDLDTLTWLRARGVRYHTLVAIRAQGWDKAFERVLKEVERGPEKFFVSVDVSVIAPGEMVAAGRLAADGLSAAEATRAIRHVCAAKDIVGFEITDLAPMMDFSRLSVVNANALLNACLAGMAARRAGYGPDEIHPMVLSHGRR